MPSSVSGTLINNEEQIKLRDLQSLLSKYIDKEVTFVNYKTSYLVPKGENFSSDVLKVDVTLSKNDSAVKNLSLVAKMRSSVNTNGAIVLLANDVLFGREIFFFEKVKPAFRELEIENGIEGQDSIDTSPKYYGGRLSLSQQLGAGVDADAIILMENLKEKGYNTMDRLKGLSFEHAMLATGKLAHFHALGMALKQRRPEIFAEARELIKKLPYVFAGEDFDVYKTFIVDVACQDPRVAKYKDRIIKSASKLKHFYPMTYDGYDEHWIGIIHGDFWLNNIMFQEVNGKAKSVKFVDYQVIQAHSLALDLPYFIFCSCQAEVIKNNFEQLLNVYYEKLIKMMKKLNLDSTTFTRQSFDDELNRVGKDRMFQCLLGLKLFMLGGIKKSDGKNQNQLNTILGCNEGTSKFYERAWIAVSKFVEKGWI